MQKSRPIFSKYARADNKKDQGYEWPLSINGGDNCDFFFLLFLALLSIRGVAKQEKIGQSMIILPTIINFLNLQTCRIANAI